MNSMKRQKDRTLKEELPKLVCAKYTTGEKWENNSRKNEEMEPKQNKTKQNKKQQQKNKTENTQLFMWMVMEARSDSVKSNIA